MTDTFKTFARSLTSPPENAHAIFPDDAADLPHVTRALYVGGGGDVAHERLGLDGGGDDQLLPLAQIEAGRHAKGGEARLEVVECHKVPRICLTAAGDSI